MKLLVTTILALGAFVLVQDTDAPHVDEKEASLREAVEGLSRSTMVDGAGPEAYAAYIREDFTRWYVGRPITEKDELIESLETWWQGGHRVGEDRTRIVALDVAENVGVVRLDVYETFVDADGANVGAFDGFVDEVWILEDDTWKLFASTIAPDPEEER